MDTLVEAFPSGPENAHATELITCQCVQVPCNVLYYIAHVLPRKLSSDWSTSTTCSGAYFVFTQALGASNLKGMVNCIGCFIGLFSTVNDVVFWLKVQQLMRLVSRSIIIAHAKDCLAGVC